MVVIRNGIKRKYSVDTDLKIYWPILPSLVIFAYVANKGHRSDRNVLLFLTLFNQCQRYIFVLKDDFFAWIRNSKNDEIK